MPLLTDEDALDLVGALRINLPPERYRLRFAPLAEAILLGRSQTQIRRARTDVLREIWDPELLQEVSSALKELEEDASRMLGFVEIARAEIEAGRPEGPFAHALAEQMMFELLEGHDRNLEATAQLDQIVADAPEDERRALALRFARGSFQAADIPPNEIRAAMSRVGRAAVRRGDTEENWLQRTSQQLALILGTERRRDSARAWVESLAEQMPHRDLADELRAVLATPKAVVAAEDPIWVEACVGIMIDQTVVKEGLG